VLLTHPDPDGIIAVGGNEGDEIPVELLIESYSKGIFPWPQTFSTPSSETETVLAWFCPHERAILEFDRIHIPTSLARQIKKTPFTFTLNRNFERVIRACAQAPRKGQDGTWITEQMIRAYTALHHQGRAWSVEAWGPKGEMLGGIYGVMSENYFSAESMFQKSTGASKLALLELVRLLREKGHTFLDIQMLTPHMERLGAHMVTRREFFSRLGLLPSA